MTRPRALLQLLRISLAPSLLADLAGGVALAHGNGAAAGLETVLRLAPVSFCLFVGGMALNARVDLEEDRVARPRRPLPAGDLPPIVASAIAFLGLVAGPLVALLLFGREVATFAGGMAAAIALYHTPLKRTTLLGPPLLGAIRGADLLLGAVACVGLEKALALAGPAAAAYLAYVAGASFIAHEEDRTPRVLLVRGGATLALVAVVVNLLLALHHGWPAADLSLVGGLIIVAVWHLVSLQGARLLFRPSGWGLRSLVPFAVLFLSLMPLVPAVAAFGAGSIDLGILCIAAFFTVRLLVRFIPPS